MIASKPRALSTNPVPSSLNYAVHDARIMTVFEHQKLTAHDFAYHTDFVWLLTQEFAVFTIKRQQGQWQLKVSHFIGIVLLPSGVTLEILPKLVANTQHTHDDQQAQIKQARRWVQHMLADLISGSSNTALSTKSLNQYSSHIQPLTQDAPPLSEWLILQFLQRLAHYQPLQQYQTHIQNQKALQGRLLVKEQLRQNGAQPHKFMCEISALHPDTLCNRLIKSALIALESTTLAPVSAKTSAKQSQYQRALRQTKRLWQPVRALTPQEYARLETHYAQALRELDRQPLSVHSRQAARQLLDIAYWLLGSVLMPAGHGLSRPSDANSDVVTHNVPLRHCLLLNMNQTFEQWASLRIKAGFERLDPSYRVLSQVNQVWLSDPVGQACLSIRPDLLIYRCSPAHNRQGATFDNAHKVTADKPRVYSHIIDIKWKHIAHSHSISASDAYQLTSYAHACNASQAWLVYPVLGANRTPVVLKQQSRPSRIELWLVPFDVLTGTIEASQYPLTPL